MTTTDIYGAALMAGATVILLYALKRASIGDRPLLASIVCWYKGSHDEARQIMGGWRCRRCGETGADLGFISLENIRKRGL